MTTSASAGVPSPGWPSSGGWPPPGSPSGGWPPPGSPSGGWPPPPPPWPSPATPPGFPPTFAAAPPPPPRKKSPLLGVIGGLAFVAAATFFGFALANYLNAPVPPVPPAPPVPTSSPTESTSTPPPSPTPTPEPSYHQVTDVPEPDLDPPEIPVPKDSAQAKTWSKQNKLYQQSVPVPTACKVRFVDMEKVSAKAYQAYLNELTGCLWGVWHDPVNAAGYQLPRPPVTVYTKPVESPCGRLDTQNAYYCSGNQRIYYANDFYTAFSDDLRGQRFPAEMILAHEFGHDIQGRTGIFYATITLEQVSAEKKAKEFNRRLELQADCFAGHWLGAIAASTSMTSQDRTNLAAAAEQIGLPQPDAYDDHGSSESRRNWLFTGLQNATITSCNTFAASSVKVR